MNLPTPVLRILGVVVRHPVGHRAVKLGVRLLAPRHRVGVMAVCVDRSNRFLVLRHVFHPTEPWGLPGGWLEAGEEPEVCAARELREETGLEAEIQGVVAAFRSDDPDHVVVAVLARVDEDEPDLRLQTAEITDGGWFELDDLPSPLARVSSSAIDLIGHRLNEQGPYKPPPP